MIKHFIDTISIRNTEASQLRPARQLTGSLRPARQLTGMTGQSWILSVYQFCLSLVNEVKVRQSFTPFVVCISVIEEDLYRSHS